MIPSYEPHQAGNVLGTRFNLTNGQHVATPLDPFKSDKAFLDMMLSHYERIKGEIARRNP